MKLLVTTYVPEWAKPELETMFDEIEYRGMMDIGRVLTEEEMISYMKGIEVIWVEFDPLTQRVLQSCPTLRVIASVRGGPHANIDMKTATELKIPVLYVPGRNQETVADFTIGLLLAATRGIALGNHLIKSGFITDNRPFNENGFCLNDINWVGSTPEKFAYLQFKGPTLSNKRLGLVGYGAIARETAKRALAFGMEVIAYDPFVTQESAGDKVRLVKLKELMETSDFVSIHLPVNKGTRGLVSADMLGRMKPGAYLVNTARAAVLDYDKLIAMLQNGTLAGAALDVYPVEPLPENHPLLALDNAVLTPHIAGCSMDPYDRSSRILLEGLSRFFGGGRPEFVHNAELYKP